MEIKHLSQAELAERWATKVATLESWRRKGCGPLYLKLNGRILYRIADVEAFERSRTYQSIGQRAEMRGEV